MRKNTSSKIVTTKPLLLDKAITLQEWISSRTPEEIIKVMKISDKLEHQTRQKIITWSTEPARQSAAIDSFTGDIYSGLRAAEFSDSDRSYAQEHLRILSGLYGILRPLDGVMPYRLEMGYKTPGLEYRNLYEFWGDAIAKTLPNKEVIINVSSDEYTKAVLPYIKNSRIITPQFLTKNTQSYKPVFVAVHAKIARGAYAKWLIQTQARDPIDFQAFDDLGYSYHAGMSSDDMPVYICSEFKGLGLSVRLASPVG